MRIFTILLGLLLVAFNGYLFFSGNIGWGIVVSFGSIIFIPLVMHFINGGLYVGGATHDSTSSTTGGVDGGIGGSGGGISGGCGGDSCL